MADEGDKDSGKPSLGRILGKSVTSTLNLVVVGSAAVGAAALHSLPILAVGGVAYAALVAWDLASPTFWKKAMTPDPAAFPAPEKIKDLAVADAVRSFLAGRARLAAVLEESPDVVKSHVGTVMTSVTEMERGAVRLVKRAEDLTRYLATTDREPVQKEMAKLDQKIRAAGDPVTRQQYESALAMRQEQIRALDDIAGAKERLVANLTRMVATLEGLPPKLVRMGALDAQAMDALSGTMSEEIDSINGDIQAFEETLKTLGESVHQ